MTQASARWILVAIALAIAVATTSAYAANTTIYACVNKSSGALKIVASGDVCTTNETPVAWNIVGLTGPTGATGPTGPTGATGPTGPGVCTPNAAASPRYVDHGEGTLTDMTTCLMWEKKTGTVETTVGSVVDCSTTTCTNPHDVNNVYQWSASGTAPDGVLFTDFLPRVNGQLCATGTCPGLGGHSDWRVPTLSELQTIVDSNAAGCGSGPACIDPAFGPTENGGYWSSATYAGTPTWAMSVGFVIGGDTGVGSKTEPTYVRAVRGGF